MPSQTAGRARPRAHDGTQAAEVAIFDATERLLTATPLHELSVAQIIREAGVSRASFYHYFASKHEVVVALMGRIWEEVYASTHDRLVADWSDVPPGDALRASLTTAMDLWFSHRAVIHAVLENQHTVPALGRIWMQARDRFAVVLAEQVRRERTAGRAVPGLDPEVVATMLVCGAERIFYVGSTGTDERLADGATRVDSIVALALAAIYGDPRGPEAA